MAEPIRLGMFLEGEDACVLDESMKHPKTTKEQHAFFREAIKYIMNEEELYDGLFWARQRERLREKEKFVNFENI